MPSDASSKAANSQTIDRQLVVAARLERAGGQEITSREPARRQPIKCQLMLAIPAVAEPRGDPTEHGDALERALQARAGAAVVRGFHGLLMHCARAAAPRMQAPRTRPRAAAGRKNNPALRRNPRRATAPV